MEINELYCGDSRNILKTFLDCSVDCCITSPPYYGLRDYGEEGQIGLEESPDLYIERLADIFDEVRRVLKDDGTLWLNIGDSYAGSGKGLPRDPNNTKKYMQGTNKGTLSPQISVKYVSNEVKQKDLIGIPWMLAFELRRRGWYLRQDIIWVKPNPMPESVKDRCTKSHEYIFLLSKSPHYYFDNEAIEEPVSSSTKRRNLVHNPVRYGGKKYTQDPDSFFRTKSGNLYNYRPMRNKRDIWTVPTVAFKEAHFATFPEKLIEPCVLAGCKPGGVVLDPFVGAGTTSVVCVKKNRNYIGIDINPEFIEIAKRRLEGTQLDLDGFLR